jgi:hypothetical protein
LTVGEQLPALRGEYLSEHKAALPEDASGKVALVAMGFSYPSRLPVQEWGKRFRAEFGGNSQVTFYEVPMLGGMARMGRFFIDRGMRRGTAKEDYEHVITVYSSTEVWKRRMGVKAADSAYLVLLDRRGNVAWRHTGSVDDAAFRELTAEVRRLLSAP